jgi:S-formylglutathione hydrolase FrmB
MLRRHEVRRTFARLLPGIALVLALVAPPPVAAQAGPRSRAARAAGRVLTDTLWSRALGTKKAVVIYLPPSYSTQPARRYPVAYYLHGLNGAETDWTTLGQLNVVADSLAATGRPEVIVVMPDGDNGYYTKWSTLITVYACRRTPPERESADTYCVRRPHYDDYIARDVVQFVDGKYRTQPVRGRRAIAGLSMGGYGAMALAFQYPDVFSAAASHSGVLSPLYAGATPFAAPPAYAASRAEIQRRWNWLWRYIRPIFGRDPAGWWSRDPARRLSQLVAQRGNDAAPALFADVGTADGFADQSRAFKWEVERLGVPLTYHEWPGGHNWLYWRAHVGESLAFLTDRIGR